MPNFTKTLNLEKPLRGEFYSIDKHNENSDKIDFAIEKITVPTIEHLKNMIELQEGDVVDIQGYYTAGDGAYHKRKIVGADDGSGVQLANGLWANIVHNGEVNVSWFGAKGDGVSDDTLAIKKTLENFSNVVFDNKQYYITDTLYISDNQNVNGNGCTVKKTVRGIQHYNNSVFSTKNYNYTDAKNKNIKIENLNCVSDHNDNVLTGINICNAEDVVLRNITTDGFGYGVRIGFSTRVKVEKCTARYAVDDGFACSDGKLSGTYTNNSYITFEDCLSELNACDTTSTQHMTASTGTSGFEVDDGGNNITFINCIAQNNNGRGFDIHIHGSSTNIYSDIFNVKYINCKAISNNALDESQRPNYNWNNCGFENSVSNLTYNRIYNVSYYNCFSTGHKNADYMCYHDEPHLKINNVSYFECVAESNLTNREFSNFFFANCNSITVDNCTVHGNSINSAIQEVNSKTSESSYSFNKISNCGANSIYISKHNGLEKKHTKITDNTIETVLKNSDSNQFVFVKNSDYISVCNNLFFRRMENATQNKSFLSVAYDNESTLTHCDIIGNSFKESGVSTIPEFIAVSGKGNSHSIIIEKNKFENISANAVCIYNPTSGFTNTSAVIQRNFLTGFQKSGLITAQQTHKVINNNFLGSGFDGVAVTLDTPYYTLKMQQEGVYEDYVNYRDELHEYEKSQKQAVEGVAMMNELIEPQPSQVLLDFKKKYLG